MSRIIIFAITTIASTVCMIADLCATAEVKTDPVHSLTITVAAVRNNTGKVCVDLFNSPDGYPTQRSRAFKQKCSPINNGTATVSFANIPAGMYAGFAFHDEDNNGDIKKNWVGMPKEGVGASNNAKGRFGPPSFSAARFSVDREKTTVSIKLRYL